MEKDLFSYLDDVPTTGTKEVDLFAYLDEQEEPVGEEEEDLFEYLDSNNLQATEEKDLFAYLDEEPAAKEPSIFTSPTEQEEREPATQRLVYTPFGMVPAEMPDDYVAGESAGKLDDYLGEIPAGFEKGAQAIPQGIWGQLGAWFKAAAVSDITSEVEGRAQLVREADEHLARIEAGESVNNPKFREYTTPDTLALLKRRRDENEAWLKEHHGIGADQIEDVRQVREFAKKGIDEKLKDSRANKFAEFAFEQSGWWRELKEEADERWKVDPVVANSGWGQFVESAGMAPSFMALSFLGPLGVGLMESQMYSFAEDDARAEAEARKEEFRPEEHIAALTSTAVGNTLLERAFGFERVADDILRSIGKNAKISLSDFAKQVFVRSQISGLEEAATEPTQGMWQDFIASISYDEGRELFTGEAIKQRFLEAAAGYALGLGMAGGMTTVAAAPQVTSDKYSVGVVIPEGAPDVKFREFQNMGTKDDPRYVEQWDMLFPEGFEGYKEKDATVNRGMLEALGYELPKIPINEETTTPYRERHPEELKKFRKELDVSETTKKKIEKRLPKATEPKIHTKVRSFKDAETGQKIRHGKPVTIGYLHGAEKVPDMGDRFGQDIEPAGKYISPTKKDPAEREGLEVGNVTFQSPLVLEWNGYGLTGWKRVLSEAFGNKTGKELSQAIRNAGYDAIITVDKSRKEQFASEVVDLTMFTPQTEQEQQQSFEESLKTEELQQAEEVLAEENEALEEVIAIEQEQKAEESAPVDAVTELSPLITPAEESLIESESDEEINYLLPAEQTAARKDMAEQIAMDNLVFNIQREIEQDMVSEVQDPDAADVLTPAESELLNYRVRLELNKLSKSSRGRIYAPTSRMQERLDLLKERAKGERAVINERIRGHKKVAVIETRLRKSEQKVKDAIAKREEDILRLKVTYEQRLEQQRVRAGEKLATETRRRISAIKQKFEERRNLQAAIRELEELRDKLPPKIRGKLRGFGSLTNIVGADKQRIFLDKAAVRVEELLDEFTVRQNQNALGKLVKKIRNMKRMPKEFEIFRKINDYGKMSRDEAVDLAEEIKAQKKQLSEEEVEDIFLLKTFGGKLNPQETIGFTGEEMRLAREEAEYIMRESRSRMKVRMEIDQIRLNRMRELSILEMIRPGDRRLTSKEIERAEQQRSNIKKMLREMDDFAVNRHSGLEMLLDNLKVKDERFTGFFQDHIVTPVFEAQMKTEMENRKDLSGLGDFIRENVTLSRGITESGKLMNMMREWGDQSYTIRYLHEGEYIAVPMSKWEMITMWMQWQDTTLRTSFEKMKINEDVMNSVEMLLGEDGIAVGKYLLEEYQRYGERLRDTVADVDNYIIPILKNYSPVSRILTTGKIEDDSQNLTDMDQVRKVSEKNRSIKTRVDNTHELAFKPANEVFAQHMYQMNHYFNFARVAKDMRAIFTNRNVRNAINQRSKGGEALKLLDGIIDDILRGGIDRAKYDKWANRIIRNLAVSKLALNVTSAAKQLGSIPAYTNEMPAHEWAKYTAQFWTKAATNPKQFKEEIETLLNTDYIQNRLSSSYDRDLKQVARQTTEQGMANIRNWRDRAMFMTRLGDVGAIVLGGHALYQYTYDQAIADKKSEAQARAEAEQKFAQATDRAQQSSQTFSQGYWQRGGSFVKAFTMFMTTPIQYHRITSNAIKAYAQGRISKRQALKTVFIYHVLLPQIFAAMGSAFIGLWSEDDDEVEAFKRRQLAALITGNFNSIFIAGDVISSVISALVEEDAEFLSRQSIPILDELSDLAIGGVKIGKAFMEDEDLEEYWEGADKLFGAFLSFAGMPYDPIKKQIDGLYRAATGDTDHPWLRLMGYSDYAIFEDDE